MFDRLLFEHSFIRLLHKDIEGITIVNDRITNLHTISQLPTPIFNFYPYPKLTHPSTAHFNYAFTIYLLLEEEDLQYKILGSLRRFIMKDRNTDEFLDLGITPGSIFYFSDTIVRVRKGNYYTVSGEFLLNARY